MRTRRTRLTWTLAAIVGVLGASVTALQAQRIWAGYYGRTPPRFPTANTFDGNFHFCRVMFESDRREKQGWSTDYPGADINLSVRLAELTKARVTLTRNWEGGDEEVPDAVVVRLTDEALFHCPFTLMEDAGTARFSDLEARRLREYLLKGGFLFVSDYHGVEAREQFDEEMARVLSPNEYPTIDISPPEHDHPLWHMMFPVPQIPQFASIQTWRRTNSTIERWNFDSAPPSARAIADDHGRLMVLMIHNSDIPDPWEREGEEKEYFFRFSPDAYAVGLDMLMYAMTH